MDKKYQIAVAALTIAASHFASAAGSSAYSSAGYSSAQITDGVDLSCQFMPGCSFAPQNSNVSFSFRGQNAAASSSAVGFELKASASVNFSVAPYDKMKASGNASFSDTLTFDDVAHHGENALVFLKYSLTGSGTVSQALGSDTWGYSYLGLQLGNGSAYKDGTAGVGYSTGILTSSTTDYYAIFFAKLGTASNLNFGLMTNCQGASVVGAASCAMSTTFTFKGVEAVALLDGTELSNFTVSSKSGFNYVNAAPVPEPSTYALMACGMGLLALRRFRQRKDH